MKTHDTLSYWLFTALMCLILGACSEDDDYSTVVEVKSGNLKAVTYNSAQFSAELSVGNAKEIGVCWSLNPNPTINDSSVSLGSGSGTFNYTLTGLEEGTQYYVRAWARVADDSIVYGEEKTCMTMAHGRPVVYVTDIVNIEEVNATIVSKMLVDGGLNISEYGIVYGSEGGVDIQNGKKVSLDITCNEVKTLIDGLIDNETYYVKSYAITNGETIYSKEVSFKTAMYAGPALRVETSKITGETFDAKVTATSGTPLPIMEYGLVYGIEPEPSVEADTKVVYGEGDGEKTLTIEGVKEGTTYYVRPYATNKNGLYYGEEVSVLILSDRAMISTVETSFVTAHRAKMGGNITYLGLQNAPITEAGICWSTSPAPTINDATVKSTATTLGEFEPVQLFCLDPSTTYYARAYVTNEYGTNYGEEVTFTTREAVGNYFTTSTEGVYFNGLNVTSGYPDATDDAFSSYQKEIIETVKKITELNSRIYTAYRYYLYPNEAGEPAFLEVTIAYKNSKGVGYRALWPAKMEVSDKFVYTCTNQVAKTNTKNYINSAAKNGLSDKLAMAVEYMINDSFVIDWEDETSTTIGTSERNAVFYMIPIHSPENYLRMGAYRVTGLKPYTPWW